MKAADPTLLAAMTQLYAGDKLLGPALADGIKAQNLSDEVLGAGMMADDGKPRPRRGGYGPGAFKPMAEAAGGLLAAADGPRVAVIDMGGWDTHVGQGTVKGRLADNLRGLADGLAQLKTSLGPAWGRTVVLSSPSSAGPWHPTAPMAPITARPRSTLLLGGAVAAAASPATGRARQLEENRDLRMATDIRAVPRACCATIWAWHRPISTARCFPDSAAVRPMGGLVRT
jgi:uncharacterized protein (DUF1501 family)